MLLPDEKGEGGQKSSSLSGFDRKSLICFPSEQGKSRGEEGEKEGARSITFLPPFLFERIWESGEEMKNLFLPDT